MKVAVNCISFLKQSDSFAQYYLQQVLALLSKKQPADEFVFIVNEECKSDFLFGKNCSEIIANNPSTTIASTAFYNIKLPLLLKKIKADIVLQPFTKTASTKKTQLIIVENAASKKLSKAALTKANSIVTFTSFCKETLLKRFRINEEKINVVPLAHSAFSETSSKNITDKSFFLFKDVLSKTDHALTVLKAFSLFKKRMQSGMHLVMLIPSSKYSSVEEKLKTYKYKEDVLLIKENHSAKDYLHNAYAFILPLENNGLSADVFRSIAAGIPVITSNNDQYQELLSTHVLMPENFTPETVSNYLNLLYRDENYRSTIVKNGNMLVESTSIENAVSHLQKTMAELMAQ